MDDGAVRRVTYRREGKAALDIVGALVGLAVLSPLYVAIGIAVRSRMGAPVLFRQARSGQHGKPFEIVKFRTMGNDPGNGDAPLSDEQRTTELGRFLRVTSLDELPQLWNVVRGEMSLVGPRPLPIQYAAIYDSDQRRRHHVRPGVTGPVQVRGRNELTWDQRFAEDLRYVDNVSFRTDAALLIASVRAVATRRGAHTIGTPFVGADREGIRTGAQAENHAE
jgi:lipopolysaccharide/colanic/teichoic acid biosynthesis glycosyltransferase